MKTRILWLLLFLGGTLFYADEHYRRVLDIVEPFTDTELSGKYAQYATEVVDPLRLKSVIANGDIAYFEQCFPSDLQLGALSATELLLLRNMVYAKYGYVFSNSDLSEYFRYFDWYKKGEDNKNISLNRNEKKLVERIADFENPLLTDYAFSGKNIVCTQFNGGADQQGCSLILKADGTFEYKMSQGISRTTGFKGDWTFTKGKLILQLQEQDYIFGGYIYFHPNTPYIANGVSASVRYEKPIQVVLPVQKSKKYFENNKDWLKIGSLIFFIEHQ